MWRWWLVVLCATLFAGACSASNAHFEAPRVAANEDPGVAIESAEPSTDHVTEPTPTPDASDTLQVEDANADPNQTEFLKEPRLNALGDPMILLLEMTDVIPPGTRVSEILADPSRYLEVRELDPSIDPRNTDYYANDAASYSWLQEQQGRIVDTGRNGTTGTLWKRDVVEEEFVDVLVAAGEIASGTAFADLLQDLRQWTRIVGIPVWQVREERWLSSIRNPLSAAELQDFSECYVDGDLADGDPIAFRDPWHLYSQQLQVTQTIRAGTSVTDLMSAPIAYLSAQVVKGCKDITIYSFADLDELSGAVAVRDIEAGEFLDVAHFTKAPG